MSFLLRQYFANCEILATLGMCSQGIEYVALNMLPPIITTLIVLVSKLCAEYVASNYNYLNRVSVQVMTFSITYVKKFLKSYCEHQFGVIFQYYQGMHIYISNSSAQIFLIIEISRFIGFFQNKFSNFKCKFNLNRKFNLNLLRFSIYQMFFLIFSESFQKI